MQRLFGETTELRLEKNDLQQQRLAALCCKISKMIGNFTNEFAVFERYAFQLCFELSKNKGFLKISKQISDTNLVLRLGNVILCDQVFFLAGKGEKDRSPARSQVRQCYCCYQWNTPGSILFKNKITT